MPRPSGRLPWLGDVLRLDPSAPVQREARWVRELGPVFEIDILGNRIVVVGAGPAAEEVMDERRFAKSIAGPVGKLRSIAGNGLVTAANSDPEWQVAHNVLMPVFSRSAMRSYHDTMVDCADQLVELWSTSETPVDVPRTLSRLTLEIIGRTGFSHSFGPLSARETPFVEAMTRVLNHVSSSSNDIPILREIVGRRSTRQHPRDVELLHSTVDSIVSQRRSDVSAPADDMLQHMLTAVDDESGRGLSVESIRNQVLTLLVAGHETTASLVGFALSEVARRPALWERIAEEVAAVCGARTIAYEDVPGLRLTRRMVDETLRLWPSAPAIFRKPRFDTTIAGFPIRKGQPVLLVLLALHRDHDLWGPDADTFDPDRFVRDRQSERPSWAYRPFGVGMRSCIGRQFALHEAVLILASLARSVTLHDPSPITVAEGLTMRPGSFTVDVRPRPQSPGSRSLQSRAMGLCTTRSSQRRRGQ